MKTILLLLISSIGMFGCACTSRTKSLQDPIRIDWPSIPEVTYDALVLLAKHYTELRAKDFNLNVREINLSAHVLKQIASESNELRLIMGADANNNIVIVLQRRDKLNVKHRYYLRDLFKDDQLGSDGLAPLCGLEPALCSPTFRKPIPGSELTQQSAKDMSGKYLSLSNVDPDRMLLQINLPPDVIFKLLADNQNVKLISAINDSDGLNTLILELMNAKSVSYVNLKTRTPEPVCPPPPHCDLTPN